MTNNQVIIYLLKDKFQIYSPAVPQVFEFRFPPEIIRDLDVLSIEQLEVLLKSFIVSTKIPPGSLHIVLAENTYFTKDFAQAAAKPVVQKADPSNDVPKELMQQQIDQFIEHVPYDNVVSKTFKLPNGVKVVAVNKEFYESIALSFEGQGFKTVTVLPGLVFGGDFSKRPVLDKGMAALVLQKANTFKEYNLLGQAVYEPVSEKKEEKDEIDEVQVDKGEPEKPNKKRLIALSGVLVSLVFVLIIVYVQSQNPPSPPQQPIRADDGSSNLPPINTNTQPTAPEVVPTTPPSELQTQGLQVQIIAADESSGVAQQLRAALGTYNFSSVTTQTQTTIGASVTQVSFSGDTSQAVRNAVLDEVKKYRTNYSVQERQSGTYDISIILSNE